VTKSTEQGGGIEFQNPDEDRSETFGRLCQQQQQLLGLLLLSFKVCDDRQTLVTCVRVDAGFKKCQKFLE
jgi:hypothetical protein